jgi:hypothetical protein
MNLHPQKPRRPSYVPLNAVVKHETDGPRQIRTESGVISVAGGLLPSPPASCSPPPYGPERGTKRRREASPELGLIVRPTRSPPKICRLTRCIYPGLSGRHCADRHGQSASQLAKRRSHSNMALPLHRNPALSTPGVHTNCSSKGDPPHQPTDPSPATFPTHLPPHSLLPPLLSPRRPRSRTRRHAVRESRTLRPIDQHRPRTYSVLTVAQEGIPPAPATNVDRLLFPRLHPRFNTTGTSRVGRILVRLRSSTDRTTPPQFRRPPSHARFLPPRFPPS